MSAQDQQNRPHHKSKEKKQRDPGSANPKAFAFANPGRFQRQAARTHDVKEKRLHVPQVDRMPEEAPPLVVAIVGPPKVGKTTLIKSLVRRYTKQTISDPRGPLTVVTSKRRRLTFLETPADSLAAMIDVAKVVDIVLLMIDGKYGYEMEIMEFLDVLKSSGMPGNVFGILTHLDLFNKPDTLRTQKKRLKTRLWKDLYQGAKLFYLSGVINGRYPDREVLNLSRFLSIMKNPRPLVWRNSHPYCLADRFLDITPPVNIENNSKCDRTIALYGYLRGTNFPAQGARVHVPGLGDLSVADIEALPDPCPTPFQEQVKSKITGKAPRRRLGDKQKVLYAPMSDVGGVMVDKDAVYIDIKNPTFDKDRDYDFGERGLGEQLVLGLQGDKRLLGQVEDGVRLFSEDNAIRRSLPMSNDDFDIDDRVDSDNDLDQDPAEDDFSGLEGFVTDASAVVRNASTSDASLGSTGNEVDFEDSDSDSGSENAILPLSSSGQDTYPDDELSDSNDVDGNDSEGALRWKEALTDRARASHDEPHSARTVDLSRLMYDSSITPTDAIRRWRSFPPRHGIAVGNEEKEKGEEEDLFTTRSSVSEDAEADERMFPTYDYKVLQNKWQDETNLISLRRMFASARLERFVGSDEAEENFSVVTDDEDEDEGDGEFEDLEIDAEHNLKRQTDATESAASHAAEREKNARRKEELRSRFEEEDRDGFANDKAKNRRDAGDQDGEFGEDEWYDAQKARIQKQLDINRIEFDEMDDLSRIRAEGHKPGTYARLVLSNVPYEFVAYFNPRHPLVIGGLNTTEERFGFIQVRIKKHRYHQKTLKNRDPLIFSLGWRRFESVPMYSLSDSRVRNRMIKYTPDHMHCFATFWGPLAAPNTGFCCVQSFSNKNPKFRLAATGTVLNVDESVDVVKKVKLKGYPAKILKNTAYIRDMFSSDLEIEKYKSAKLKTVSGVRGMVKARAGSKFPEGWIRATFEDKIIMSDIVFLTGWTSVKPPEYYNTVTNLLVDGQGDAGSEWLGMRTTGRLRAETGLATPQVKDSQYRKVERATRHFNPLRVPRKLASELPFKSQIVQMKPQRKETYLAKRAVVLGGDEKRARDLLQKVSTLRNEKTTKRAVAQEKRKEGYRKKIADNLEKKDAREKRERDDYWRREGRKRKGEDLGAGRAPKRNR